MKTIIFEKLLEKASDINELKAYDISDPYNVAALTILALELYARNKDEGIKAINILKGPQPLSGYEISFLNDRFMDKDYVPRSYFEGSTSDNNYQPNLPYTISIYEDSYTYQEENYAKLNVQSSGADLKRPIKLRVKDGQWYLWEQMILSGIKEPKSYDPWS